MKERPSSLEETSSLRIRSRELGLSFIVRKTHFSRSRISGDNVFFVCVTHSSVLIVALPVKYFQVHASILGQLRLIDVKIWSNMSLSSVDLKLTVN